MVENHGIDVIQYCDNDGNFYYGTNSRRAIKEEFYLCAEISDGSGKQYLRKAEQIAIKHDEDFLDFLPATKDDLDYLLGNDGATFYVAQGFDETGAVDEGESRLIKLGGRVHPSDAGKDVNDHNGVELTELAMAPCHWIRRVFYIY